MGLATGPFAVSHYAVRRHVSVELTSGPVLVGVHLVDAMRGRAALFLLLGDVDPGLLLRCLYPVLDALQGARPHNTLCPHRVTDRL